MNSYFKHNIKKVLKLISTEKNHYQTTHTKATRVLFTENSPAVIDAARVLLADKKLNPIFLNKENIENGEFEVFKMRRDAHEWTSRAIKKISESQVTQKRPEQVYDIQHKNSDLNLAALLLNIGYIDIVLSGVEYPSSEVIRAGIKILCFRENCETLTSSYLMVLPEKILTYADCAVIPEPSSDQLAEIAFNSAQFHQKITGDQARVAMLSFSTKGSSKHPSVIKIREAIAKFKARTGKFLIDGEIQFDAAINPLIGNKKAPDSCVAGQANVFIFPDLNSANIACKITQQIGGAVATGPFLHGLKKPWIDMSRGSTAQEIIKTVQLEASLLNLPQEEI